MAAQDAEQLIVGAGPTGLMLALTLAKAGRASTIVEAAKRLEAVGAGISLPPNATRLFDYLGLGEELGASADRPAAQVILDYRTGQPIARVDRDLRSGSQLVPFLQLHRASLVRLLVAAAARSGLVTLLTGRRLVDARPTSSGAEAVFADGSRLSTRLLVGCDGVKSAVRDALFGATPTRFTGQVAFRCVVPAERVATHMGAGPSALFIGPGAIFNRYVIGKGQEVNCVAIVRSETWTDDGWSTRSSFDEVRSHLTDWHEDVLGPFAAAEAGSIMKWGLIDRAPLRSWSSGCIGLAGDAAHAMLPFMGMGAALSMEDAVVLGRLIVSDADASTALSSLHRLQGERCERAQADSVRQGELYQGLDPGRYALGADFELRRRYFDYDATSVEGSALEDGLAISRPFTSSREVSA